MIYGLWFMVYGLSPAWASVYESGLTAGVWLWVLREGCRDEGSFGWKGGVFPGEGCGALGSRLRLVLGAVVRV